MHEEVLATVEPSKTAFFTPNVRRTMERPQPQPNRNNVNLIVDSAIFIAFLVAMAPRFSGMVIHEWLGIAFGAAIVTHLLLHWQWLVEVTNRFFGKAQWSARINYITACSAGSLDNPMPTCYRRRFGR